MAKKTQIPQAQTPTELTYSKEEFTKSLNEQILIGEGILTRVPYNEADFSQAWNDYTFWFDYTSEFLKQAFNKEINEYKKSFDDAGTTSYGYIVSSLSNYTPTFAEQVEKFRNKVSYKVDALKKLRSKIPLLKSSVANLASNMTNSKADKQIDKTYIFIVHGHDDEAKSKTARFIEKIGFKPVILHEQASSGRTIIEKIEQYSNVGFGIILYTPCDIGSKKMENPSFKDRARQNVIFEHGYLIGKIGRNNVCALVKGDIETPNDISGVVYIKMDIEDAWHVKLARELKNSGYPVDLNDIM